MTEWNYQTKTSKMTDWRQVLIETCDQLEEDQTASKRLNIRNKRVSKKKEIEGEETGEEQRINVIKLRLNQLEKSLIDLNEVEYNGQALQFLVNTYRNYSEQSKLNVKKMIELQSIVKQCHLYYFNTLFYCNNYIWENDNVLVDNEAIKLNVQVLFGADQIIETEIHLPFLNEKQVVQISKNGFNIFKKQLLDEQFTGSRLQNRMLFSKYLCVIYLQIQELENKIVIDLENATWDKFLSQYFVRKAALNNAQHDSINQQIQMNYEEEKHNFIETTAKSILPSLKNRTLNSIIEEIYHREMMFLRGDILLRKANPTEKKKDTEQSRHEIKTHKLSELHQTSLRIGHEMYRFNYATILENCWKGQVKASVKEDTQDMSLESKTLKEYEEQDDSQRKQQEEASLKDSFLRLLQNHYAFKQYTGNNLQYSQYNNINPSIHMSRMSRNQLRAATRRLKHILASPYIPSDKKQEAIANFNRLTLFLA